MLVSPAGQFYECMNMASLYKLPCIFVVENNKWAIGMYHPRCASARALSALCSTRHSRMQGSHCCPPGQQCCTECHAIVRCAESAALSGGLQNSGSRPGGTHPSTPSLRHAHVCKGLHWLREPECESV